MTGRSFIERVVIVGGFLLAAASGIAAWRISGPYGERGEYDPRTRQIYTSDTGLLEVVAFDADGDLQLDRWSYVSEGKLIRLDVDDDRDGKVEKRQYYGDDELLDRVEFLDAGGQVVATEWSRSNVVVAHDAVQESR